MENFILYNPTKLHFGKGVVSSLGKVVSAYGKKVLLVYGKNSIKKNGIYNDVVNQLNENSIEYFEYSGIKSNPVIDDVDAAAKLGREKNVDLILAVGGGSVIDSAKIISLAIPVENPAWDIIEGKVKPVKSIPLVSVLTLAATGTEMNPFAVVQNQQLKKKIGYFSPLIYPKNSFLDPEYTYSVPFNYTAYGIADLIAHSLEAFFGKYESSLSDRISISCIKEAIEYGPALLNDLNNYDLRAKIMYASTIALNGMTLQGKGGGDWGVHDAGHILSVLYDLPHGASLSIVYPAWLKNYKEKAHNKILFLGKELFNSKDVDETIFLLESFFKEISCPVRLYEAGIGEEKFDIIYNTMIINKVNGNNYKMEIADYKKLINFMK